MQPQEFQRQLSKTKNNEFSDISQVHRRNDIFKHNAKNSASEKAPKRSAGCVPIFGSSQDSKRGSIVPKDSIVIKEGILGKIGNKSSLLVNRYYILRDHALFIYHSREQKVPS